jgi:hypothetical protein
VITRWFRDGTLLMDREDLSSWLDRPVATIRARCQPAAHDIATKRPLYDADACLEKLKTVKRRTRLAKAKRL